jgi:5-methyltetrahydrofolate--homocysteine methyltransferase
MASVVTTLSRESSLPIMTMPNAGIPTIRGNQTVFDVSPENFAADIFECIKAGARLIGGCCGTNPDHIRAIKKLLQPRR